MRTKSFEVKSCLGQLSVRTTSVEDIKGCTVLKEAKTKGEDVKTLEDKECPGRIQRVLRT